MSEPSVDHVLHIDEELTQLSPIPFERCIYRVHDLLRNENANAYEPEVVAIGPYHRGKDKLKPMEEHKLRYLQQLLKRRNETSAERYVVAMKKLEERARKVYAEPISLDTDELAKMMLLDSCFIIELFRKHAKRRLMDKNDPIFSLRHMQTSLKRDLMLIENQLPLFILVEFLNMTNILDLEEEDIIDMSFQFFKDIIPAEISKPPNGIIRALDIKHLLGLVHCYFCHQFHSMVISKQTVGIQETPLKSATEIQEAGIKFKKSEGRNLFDIKFVKGTMEIPTLFVGDVTEIFLRNLIAYEQYLPDSSWKYFTAYHHLLDKLVETSEDVEILSRHGIIDNFLGDNEVVAKMLNKLGNNITISFIGYPEVYNDVNEHCRGRWNIWLAMLRRKYFNNPWAFISFVAAVVLLLLTVAQTVCSILSVV